MQASGQKIVAPALREKLFNGGELRWPGGQAISVYGWARETTRLPVGLYEVVILLPTTGGSAAKQAPSQPAIELTHQGPTRTAPTPTGYFLKCLW